jgi:hypothetical protein
VEVLTEALFQIHHVLPWRWWDGADVTGTSVEFAREIAHQYARLNPAATPSPDAGELERLRALSEAATPGPWRVSDGGMSYLAVSGRGQNLRPIAECWQSEPKADAALLVAAVNYVRAALEGAKPAEAGRDRVDEANALGYREGYRAGRAAGITEVIDAQHRGDDPA